MNWGGATVLVGVVALASVMGPVGWVLLAGGACWLLMRR